MNGDVLELTGTIPNEAHRVIMKVLASRATGGLPLRDNLRTILMVFAHRRSASGMNAKTQTARWYGRFQKYAPPWATTSRSISPSLSGFMSNGAPSQKSNWY